MTHRRVLRGGLVPDGIGHDLRRADVLIADDAIEAVSSRQLQLPRARSDRRVW